MEPDDDGSAGRQGRKKATVPDEANEARIQCPFLRDGFNAH